MLNRIKIHTPDGTREYPFAPDAAALQAAANAGEVREGDEIIYKQWLVWIFSGTEQMLILDIAPMPVNVFGGGTVPPEQVQWNFTAKGDTKQ